MKLQLLLAWACLAPVSANLVITEIMSSSRHTDATRNGDWWELTNTGATAVNLQNYSWDDSLPIAGTVKFNAGISILPGESVVILDALDATSFKAAWGLDGTNPLTSLPYQVLKWADFTPGTGFPGFSSVNADGVYLFTPANLLMTSVAYTTPSASGFSRAWFTNGTAVPGEFSVNGQLGATTSTDATPDVASPGHASDQPPNTAPYFVGETRTFWSTLKDLAYSQFRVQALDADAGQFVSYTVLNEPAWLLVSPDGPGKMRLTGKPAAGNVGDFFFTVRATDNAAGAPLSTDRTFTLTVFPPTGPVLLNEYNAVGSGDLLDPLSIGSDTYFGVVAGNGGDWFELVVTGTGVAGSTVDLRGWKIEIFAGGSTKTLVLSADPYWSNVMAGTILTFTEDNTAGGGLDTAIHKVSSRNLTGHVWSNIWIRDPVFINQAASDIGSGITIDNSDTLFTIRNPSGTVVLGPCGEGIASDHDTITGYPTTLASVSSLEVLALRSNPAPAVDPLFGNYTDQSSSSFGSPNVWSSGTKVQSFIAYFLANTPPRITSTPVRHATGSYSYTIVASDPNGTPPHSPRACPRFSRSPATPSATTARLPWRMPESTSSASWPPMAHSALRRPSCSRFSTRYRQWSSMNTTR
ncbi:MAG: lamin tail domain-containing protein [Akkermansiaceae bacterium]|nr:lamin tail domain-containing protein [Akkermansiaceae bacterium]